MKNILNELSGQELTELQKLDEQHLDELFDKVGLKRGNLESQSMINRRKLYNAALSKNEHSFEKLHAVTIASKSSQENKLHNALVSTEDEFTQLIHDYYQNIDELIKTEDGSPVKFPLILADPPYNQGIDAWDIAFDFGEMIKIFSQHLDTNGTLLIYNRAQSLGEIESYLDENGLELVRTAFWQKPNPNQIDKHTYITDRAREYILVIKHKDVNNEDLTFNLLGTENFNLGVFHYSVDVMTDYEKYMLFKDFNLEKHPTVKPLQLEIELIMRHSNVEDYVWVPFAGSGADVKACMTTYRKCIAFEIDPNYLKYIHSYRLTGDITEIIDYEDDSEFDISKLDEPGRVYNARAEFIKRNKKKTKGKVKIQKIRDERIAKVREIEQLRNQIQELDEILDFATHQDS